MPCVCNQELWFPLCFPFSPAAPLPLPLPLCFLWACTFLFMRLILICPQEKHEEVQQLRLQAADLKLELQSLQELHSRMAQHRVTQQEAAGDHQQRVEQLEAAYADLQNAYDGVVAEREQARQQARAAAEQTAAAGKLGKQVWTCMCMHVPTCTRARARVCACINVCIRACIRVTARAPVPYLPVFLSLYPSLPSSLFPCVCVCVCVCGCWDHFACVCFQLTCGYQHWTSFLLLLHDETCTLAERCAVPFGRVDRLCGQELEQEQP